MLNKETVLSGAAHPHTQLEVMGACNRSGFYLGFRDADGSPYSRETLYMPKSKAQELLALIRGN
jgi:hypothetical protein